MPDKITIVLVDDQQLIRESWSTMLSNDPRFSVIAHCADPAKLDLKLGMLKPDIILLNLNATQEAGLKVAQTLTSLDTASKIIVVCGTGTSRYVQKMFAIGVKGFLKKSAPFEELKNAIPFVHEGRHYISEELRNDMAADNSINNIQDN